MDKIRWIIRNGKKILQYLEVKKYEDGLGRIDKITKWTDVPLEEE